MVTYLRKATIADLADIVSVIEDGRQTLKESHIPQWQNGDGPNEEVLKKDIQNDQCYVMLVEKEIAGVGVLVSDIDPAYENMCSGSWQAASLPNYTAIHRVALKRKYQGQGLAVLLLQYLITAARLLGATDIRIDTHSQNKAMQHLIKKVGFEYQGEVLLAVMDGERYAYQMILA